MNRNPFESDEEEEKETQSNITDAAQQKQPNNFNQQPYTNNTQYQQPPQNPQYMNYHANTNAPYTNQYNHQHHQTDTQHTNSTHIPAYPHNYFSKEQQIAQAHIDIRYPYTPSTNHTQEGQYPPQYTAFNQTTPKGTIKIPPFPSNHIHQAHQHPYNHMPINQQQYATHSNPHTQYYNASPHINEDYNRHQYNQPQQNDQIRYQPKDDDDVRDYLSSRDIPKDISLKLLNLIDNRKSKYKLFR